MRNLDLFPLQIGILGCGRFVQQRILPLLQQMACIRVICIHNRNLRKAEEIATQYGIPKFVCKREELLADSAIEAVYIATPNFLHEEDALACAQANKPTLCEKPLSISLSSVDRILLAFQKQKTPLFVGHQMRFKPAIEKAKELLQQKVLGKVLFFRSYFYSSVSLKNSWRTRKENRGGALQEIGVHLIDLIHFLFDEELFCANALMNSRTNESEVFVSLQGHFQKSKTILTIEGGFECSEYNGFEIIGTRGRIISENSLRQTPCSLDKLFLISEDNKEKIDIPLPKRDVYYEEFKEVAESIVYQTPSRLTATISRASQRVIDDAYRQGFLIQED